MKKKKEVAPDPHALVVNALRTKSVVKQDIYQRTKDMYAEMKEVLQEIATDLERSVKDDERIKIGFVDKGSTACELKVAGDTLIFHMHTNIFRLDQSNNLWKTSYLEEDEMRGYFGVVNVYNFLSDSFTYNRERDIGYLVSRLFLNKEGHFFVQGKRQMGFLYNDLATNVLDRKQLKELLYVVINYVMQFDLLAPPYDQVNQVSVSEMNELNANQQISTGKRLGFRFQSDVDAPH